ncbi:MAG: leucine-rich repeat domain-containing protein [Bacilli bacterium]|jgi:hypothetical protein|nr:leucine-rich repeat domain-containing protein [Bacilli bacterium]
MKKTLTVSLLALTMLVSCSGKTSTSSPAASVAPSDSVSSSVSTSVNSTVPEAQEIKVTYQDYDGTSLQESTITYGEAIPSYTGETPHRDIDATYFYVFTGWKENFKDATHLIYTATYEARDYTRTDCYSWAFTDATNTEIELVSFSDPYREFADVVIPDTIQYQGTEYPVVQVENFAINSQFAKSVHLGKNIKTVAPLFISTYASVSVAYLSVDPDNENFTCIDGILYNKDVTTLVKVPMCLVQETYTLPDTVTELGEMSLQDTRGIRNFATTSSSQLKVIDNQAFAASLVHDVVLPNGLKTIHIRAFWLAENILTLEIPGTVDFSSANDSIQFASMPNLNTVTFDEGITTLPDSGFSGCPLLSKLVLPSTLKTIPRYCFFNDTALKEVVLPAGLTTIAESAFMNSGIYILTVDGVTATSNFMLPDGITEIADWAFASSNIQGTVTIPKNVTKIGDYSFYGDDYINGYEVADGNTAFSAEDGILYNADKTSLYKMPSTFYGTYVLPDTVTALADSVFSGNRSITHFVAGKGLKTIGDNAFANSIVTSVSLNEGLTTLGKNAFNNAHGLETIGFPTTLTEIPEWCFYGASLTSVTSWGGVTSLGDYAFGMTTGLTSLDLSSSSIATIGSFAFYSLGNGITSIKASPALTTVASTSFGFDDSLKSLDLSLCTAFKETPTDFLSNVSSDFNTLILPSSLTKMDHDTLPTLSKLTAISYTGSKDQWNTLVTNSLLTTDEKLANSTWKEWFGSNYSTLTKVTVNYGTTSQTDYTVDLRTGKGIIA